MGYKIFFGFIVSLLFCAGLASAQIYINEVEVNPAEGSGNEGEWIELYNSADVQANIGEYVIKDNVDSYTIPADTIINPKKVIVIEYSESKLELNNNGEIITLKDEKGVEIDKFEGHNEGSRSTKTYQRTPDGTNNWEFREQTKGETNVLKESPDVNTPEFPGMAMVFVTLFSGVALAGKFQISS